MLEVEKNGCPVNTSVAAVGETTRVAPVDTLLGACAAGDVDFARALIVAHPSLIASHTRDDAQALNVAVGENRYDAVRLMLSLGWPTYIESEWGGTPLHWAACGIRLPAHRLVVHRAESAPDVGRAMNWRDAAPTTAVRLVFDVVFKASADAWWNEVGALLNPKGQDLKTWLASSFFDHHLKRYSKSRRKAPILWQLAVPSGGYSVCGTRFRRAIRSRSASSYGKPSTTLRVISGK